MSINSVRFSNPGKIDPQMWSTFGVSVKETNDAIGMFGTGLKYAIAVLMREGRSLSIDSGNQHYKFGVASSEIRGKEFTQITCNGETLPFTTHLGSHWELWQAYRELYSNCIDEGGSLGDSGDTVITAELGDIDHNTVFLDTGRRQIHSSRYCDIYAGGSSVIYYKGIRAMELTKNSLYTYNIKQADLTEDRTLKYTFQLHMRIADAALECNDTDFARQFLTQTKNYFESGIDFDMAGSHPSKAVQNIVAQMRRDNVYLQPGMLKSAVEHMGCDVYDPVEMDDRQRAVIDKASDFCSRIGMPIRYPVKYVPDLGVGTLALADRKSAQIYLSDRVLTQGVKQVASTLIEENLHLQEGLNDCTYDMQTYLFDQIVTMGEKLTNEVL